MRLVECARFLAPDDADARQRFAAEVFDRVQLLARFPRSGRVLPELGPAHIRELIVRGHRVIYRVRPGVVELLTIRDGRRRFDPEDVDQT